jgi:hypothetical protein
MARPVARILCGVALTTTLVVTNTPAQAARGAATGPSSSQSPYVLPSQTGVVTKSVLTVGDSVNLKPDGTPYRMVGIPDGLGAFDNGDGTFTVLMNHELGGSAGAVRAHGATGAFVSKWTIRKDDLSVVAGEDLIKQVALWNIDAAAYDKPGTGVVISRLCSADLPLPSALFNAATGNGYDGRIFLDGEEVAGGRAFAHLMNGTSYELPWMGKASWENILANPGTGDKTVVAGLDDTTPGQVYVYAGDKKSSGSPVERAGLTGGKLFGITVDGFSEEEPLRGPIPSGTRFAVHDFGDASAKDAGQIETEGDGAGVTDFLRPEDGAWDPKRPSDLYFVTTATFGGNSRLWRLRFDDPSNPAMGGVIDMLLDGTENGGTGERYHMLDNMTINGRGQLVLQEDTGNQNYLARIWQYDIASDTLTEVAHHDPDRFGEDASARLTVDEESSGAIDVSTILGSGWYLLDVQAHYNPGDSELVEGGQLLAMHIPPGRR